MRIENKAQLRRNLVDVVQNPRSGFWTTFRLYAIFAGQKRRTANSRGMPSGTNSIFIFPTGGFGGGLTQEARRS
jgi:hypothetical protein